MEGLCFALSQSEGLRLSPKGARAPPKHWIGVFCCCEECSKLGRWIRHLTNKVNVLYYVVCDSGEDEGGVQTAFDAIIVRHDQEEADRLGM